MAGNAFDEDETEAWRRREQWERGSSMSEQPKQYPEEKAEAWVEAAAVEDALQEARTAATALAVAGSRSATSPPQSARCALWNDDADDAAAVYAAATATYASATSLAPPMRDTL